MKLLERLKNRELLTIFITFCFAFVIWILIYNYNDPVTIESYSVEVDLLNKDILNKNSKVYRITQGKTVSLRIKAKQSFFKNITKEDIVATADLSNLSEVNATSINVNILNTNDSDWEVVGKYPELLKVDLDEYVSQQFPLEINAIGNLPDNKYLKEFACSPSMVTISGPKSVMDNIFKVVVEPNLTNAEQGYNTNCNVIVLDKDNNNITDNYNLDTSMVKVEANILTKKTIPIKMNVIENVPIGYELLKSDFEPKNITIAGLKSDLENLKEININYTVNQIDNIEKNISLEDYLDKNIILIDNNEVNFKAEISAFDTKEIIINSSNINVQNLKNTLRINSISMISDVLKITGPIKELDKINLSNFNIYVDAKNLNSGSIDITCNVVIDEEFKDIQILSAPSIELNLKKK